MPTISALPDGSVHEHPRDYCREIALKIGKRLAEDAVAAKVNGN